MDKAGGDGEKTSPVLGVAARHCNIPERNRNWSLKGKTDLGMRGIAFSWKTWGKVRWEEWKTEGKSTGKIVKLKRNYMKILRRKKWLVHKGHVVREELAANLGFFLACLRAKPVFTGHDPGGLSGLPGECLLAEEQWHRERVRMESSSNQDPSVSDQNPSNQLTNTCGFVSYYCNLRPYGFGQVYLNCLDPRRFISKMDLLATSNSHCGIYIK